MLELSAVELSNDEKQIDELSIVELSMSEEHVFDKVRVELSTVELLSLVDRSVE